MYRKPHTRRDWLRSAGLAAAGATLLPGAEQPLIPASRLALLEEVERRACLYFLECADSQTGLVLDRARIAGHETRRIASIAATGFGLSSLCIAHSLGILSKSAAERRVERTLEFFARTAFHQNGFCFHFLDASNGRRAFDCELSSIDTAWLLCGVIHARQHFGGGSIRRLASEILGRVNWRWMLAGGETLSHGWTPERGFLPWRWDQYSELLAMYLLALGSSTFPVPASAWDAWERPARVENEGDLYIESPAPLFVHQYSHAWFDFRGKQDGYADYFRNSTVATQRHRAYCIGLNHRFPWFGEDMWGVTASDSRSGYIDWGGPKPETDTRIDGTLVPCASGGSVVFLPDQCSRVLETMLQRYGNNVWTRYGFVDAFHPGANWYGPDVLGIDLGIMLLMAENLRTGSVWQAMMRAPEVRRGFQLAGFFAPQSF